MLLDIVITNLFQVSLQDTVSHGNSTHHMRHRDVKNLHKREEVLMAAMVAHQLRSPSRLSKTCWPSRHLSVKSSITKYCVRGEGGEGEEREEEGPALAILCPRGAG